MDYWNLEELAITKLLYYNCVYILTTYGYRIGHKTRTKVRLGIQY
jgi:hypothetical protein